ncbi:proline--tRNA ligase [Rhizosphaericola mali]|uniref:Proline--tRNA ligase n=1 Tax=Rhizosphaericola mali TaxID=2545455 RepID=A0A5P2G1D3_9BACT|nr:proline--tRNA ligase [Rhizosphaericola mali]QES87909.1 proline--tRNA ligase [Rhizosphaericola mali]
MNKEITSREIDYSQWYNDLIIKGGMADYSAVRGCMIIKPYGFALWENMQGVLDKKFKETGHQNAYFPLFVPKSLFEAEETNAEGFAKECAVVTHYRLKSDPDKKGKLIVDPEAKLEEELVVRPTSEAIIWNTYKGWIQSYRDLPILINQWANVVRWEMRTRLFLRTAEFLWQEGHTAHATEQEAIDEAKKMLHVYADFVENYMALPVIRGIKSPNERFAGAVETFCIEALMQDGKALQAGTSHFLGQNFAKAFDVKFSDNNNKLDYVWATSWGVSTRLIGALVMAHGDDDGLVMPPKIAPIQVVIVPIFKGEDQLATISQKVNTEIIPALTALGIRVKFDDDATARPGWKFAEYEKKGVPVRMALGARDLENNVIEVARRDTKEKQSYPLENIANTVADLLEEIQKNLFGRSLKYREEHITNADTWDEFVNLLDTKAGFIAAHWDGTPETEEKIKELSKATIRCIPLDNKLEEGNCILTGKPSKQRVLFARAY